ncbi:nitroreductase family protein [bacterium]|nr:nitroreductase family protein [bacterium]
MADREKVRQFLFQRRSIRHYTTEPVHGDDITVLLEAGMAAPSANNSQPWSFVVVTERSVLDQLAQAHPYGKMLFEAPLAIAVVADPTKSPHCWVQDCAAATENILLAASGLGLGAVWLGIYPRTERLQPLHTVLAIPEGLLCLSLLSIGHPAERKEPRCQYDQSRIYWNKWRGERSQ